MYKQPPSLCLPPDSREETVLGSIPLPSYVVSAVGADDHISRKFAFKVCFLCHIFPFKMFVGVGSPHRVDLNITEGDGVRRINTGP